LWRQVHQVYTHTISATLTRARFPVAGHT
jgi:hypothetical protein